MSTQPSFSIVIPTFGRQTRLAALLESLCRQDAIQTAEDIIVVENGEKSIAERVCVERSPYFFKPIQYHYLPDANLSNARNTGLRYTRSEWAILLDDDVRPRPGCITAYVEAFSAQKAPAFFGGPVFPDYDEEPESWLKIFFPPSAAGFYLGDRPLSLLEAKLIGPNLAISKELVNQGFSFDLDGATGFNSGLMGEETRLQEKLIAAGVPVQYVPGAAVDHHVPRERCSVAWARQRHFRIGLTQACFRDAADERTIQGIPFWMLRKLTIDGFRALVSPFFVSDQSKLMDAMLSFDYAKGLVMGSRERRRRQRELRRTH